MKKIKFILPLIVITIIFITCKKTPEIPLGGNKIEIGESTTDSLSYYTAKVSTNIEAMEGNVLSQHGHCWSTEKEPTIDNNKTSFGKLTKPTIVTSELTNLLANTHYYIRLYVTYNENTVYLSENTIQTLATGKPMVITNEVTNITINTATCGGTNDDGGLTISQRGLCWNTTGNPTLENSIGQTTDSPGTGSFSIIITGLNEGVAYYATAYATNEKGTGYGDVKQFATVPITTPTVTTTEITEITNATVTSGGNVTNNGNGTVTERGVCWNTTGNPTLQNSLGQTNDGDGTGSFTSNITGLTENTTYYVAAYATNEKGTSYGQTKSYLTTNDFIDPRDGQAYRIVVIGSQTWFAENLNYDATNSWWYDNNSTNGDIYGRLYTWDAALAACPPGWKLPSDGEWTILTDFLEGENVAGGKMKESGYAHWNSPNTGATNSSNFTALPGGYRSSSGSFYDLGSYGDWWSSSETGARAWYRSLYYGYDRVHWDNSNKTNGFSVRCLKD